MLFGDLFDGVTTDRFVLSDGTSLALMRAVPDGASAGTVLLVHGFTGSKEDFILLLGDLAKLGWTCLAHDHRGQYESPAPGRITIDELAADLVELVSAQQGPVHLVGHSFGGLIAQRALLLAPERVSSLTLLCSGPAGLGDVERVRVFRELLAQGMDLPEVFRRKREIDAEPMPEMLEKFLADRFAASTPDAMDQMAADLMNAGDVIDEVARVGAEHGIGLHVARGVDDASWPTEVQDEMAARLGTEVVLIPDSGHTPMLENSDVCAEVLDRLMRD